MERLVVKYGFFSVILFCSQWFPEKKSVAYSTRQSRSFPILNTAFISFVGLFFLSTAAYGQLGWDDIFPRQNGLDGAGARVNDMFVSGTNLYLTGTFEKAGGSTSMGVARWDGDSWQTYPQVSTKGWNTGEKVVEAEGNLYVSIPGGGLRRFTGSGWEWIGDTADTYNHLLPSVEGGTVYLYGVAGSFFIDKPDMNGNLAEIATIGRISGNKIEKIAGMPVIPGLVSGDAIESFLAHNGKFYVAGKFKNLYGVETQNVLMYNGTTWTAMGSGLEWSSNPASAVVHNIRVIDDTIYAVGNFNKSGTTTFTSFGIAKWNGATWESVGNYSGTITIRDITKGPDGLLYAAQTSGLARLKTNTYWSKLGDTERSGGSIVRRVENIGNYVYIAGQFDEIDDKGNITPSWNIARYKVIEGSSTLAAPSDLTATGVGRAEREDDNNVKVTQRSESFGKIRLDWNDNSENENGFIIQRSTDGTGGWLNIDSVEANTVTFTDVNLPASTTYYYQVLAYNSSSVSAPSNKASATTLATSITLLNLPDESIIYPNPVSEILLIKITEQSSTDIAIVDVAGKEVLTLTKLTKDTPLSISHLQAGIYFLKVKSADRFQTHKFLKN